MTPPRNSALRSRTGTTVWSGLLLAAILAAAAYFRLVGLNWDQGTHLHPDERFLALVESALEPVGSIREYFDTAHSPLNPNNRGYSFFVYGDFPVIVVQYLGRWLAAPDNGLDRAVFGVDLGTDYDTVSLVGRGLSAVCDLATLVFLFAIGRRLYGSAVGRLASALYAGAVLPIQQAHFFTVDAWASMFATAVVCLAARGMDTSRWSDDVLLGVALGLGGASKISVLPVGLIAVLAIALRLGIRLDASSAPRQHPAESNRWPPIIRAVLGLHIVALTALFAFRAAQPYAFLPAEGHATPPARVTLLRDVGDAAADLLSLRLNPAWRDQMREVAQQTSGAADHPPVRQWINRRALVFPWMNMVRFGLGWPLGLAAWIGWAGALAQILRRRAGWTRHVLPVAWIGLLFGWQGTRLAMSMRYFLLIYPALILMAAWLLVTVARAARAGRGPRTAGARLGRALAPALIVMVVISTFGWGFAFTRIYTRPHSRIAASQWIYEHVPSAVTLVLDAGDGPLTYQLGLPHNWAPADAPAADAARPRVEFTYLAAGESHAFDFTLPRSGKLTAFVFNHVVDPSATGAENELDVAIASPEALATPLAAATVRDPFLAPDRGSFYRVDTSPVRLEAGRAYALVVMPRTRPLVFSGATIATEGTWDDALPLPLSGYDPWDALYHEYALEMSWEDTPQKRARLQYILDRADYVVISSNRFSATLPRLPERWPLSTDYYRALFSGGLGFELVRDFTSAPTLCGVEIDDQSAEEAFTVYDHPRVSVFRKTPAYRSQATAQILGRANLEAVVRTPAQRPGLDVTNGDAPQLNPSQTSPAPQIPSPG